MMSWQFYIADEHCLLLFITIRLRILFAGVTGDIFNDKLLPIGVLGTLS